jgi:hypothetical protein
LLFIFPLAKQSNDVERGKKVETMIRSYQVEGADLSANDDSDIQTVGTNTTPFTSDPNSGAGTSGEDDESSLENHHTSIDYRSHKTAIISSSKGAHPYYPFVVSGVTGHNGGARNATSNLQTTESNIEEAGLKYHRPSYYKRNRNSAIGGSNISNFDTLKCRDDKVANRSPVGIAGPWNFDAWTSDDSNMSGWCEFPESVFTPSVADLGPELRESDEENVSRDSKESLHSRKKSLSKESLNKCKQGLSRVQLRKDYAVTPIDHEDESISTSNERQSGSSFDVSLPASLDDDSTAQIAVYPDIALAIRRGSSIAHSADESVVESIDEEQYAIECRNQKSNALAQGNMGVNNDVSAESATERKKRTECILAALTILILLGLAAVVSATFCALKSCGGSKTPS